MKQLRWTTAAADDLECIIKYIRKDNPEVARQVAVEIFQSLERLLTFPGLGRLGQKLGTRELPIPPFVVVYRIREDFVETLRIWHGAQHRQ